jgi:hypothetical protein
VVFSSPMRSFSMGSERSATPFSMASYSRLSLASASAARLRRQRKVSLQVSHSRLFEVLALHAPTKYEFGRQPQTEKCPASIVPRRSSPAQTR